MEKKINLREEFKKEQKRLRKIIKKLEKEYEAELIKSPIPDIPKRVTKQSVEKIKAIKPATIKQLFDEQKATNIPKSVADKTNKTVTPSVEKVSIPNQGINVTKHTTKEATKEVTGNASSQLPLETDVVLAELYRILNNARTDLNNKMVADYIIEVIEDEISSLEFDFGSMGNLANHHAKSIIVKRIQGNPQVIELAQIVAYDSNQETVNITAIEILNLVTGGVTFEESETVDTLLTYGVKNLDELGGT